MHTSPTRHPGSRYRMTTRCTIITRVVTEEGIVGEAYTGDEDESQSAIIRIIQDEDARVAAAVVSSCCC